jgi:hypothetical protein
LVLQLSTHLSGATTPGAPLAALSLSPGRRRDASFRAHNSLCLGGVARRVVIQTAAAAPIRSAVAPTLRAA